MLMVAAVVITLRKLTSVNNIFKQALNIRRHQNLTIRLKYSPISTLLQIFSKKLQKNLHNQKYLVTLHRN